MGTFDQAKLDAFVVAFRTGYSDLSEDRDDDSIENIVIASCNDLANGISEEQVTEKIRVLAANKGGRAVAGSGRADLPHRHTGLPVTPAAGVRLSRPAVPFPSTVRAVGVRRNRRPMGESEGPHPTGVRRGRSRESPAE